MTDFSQTENQRQAKIVDRHNLGKRLFVWPVSYLTLQDVARVPARVFHFFTDRSADV
jgi:hypothetical protein